MINKIKKKLWNVKCTIDINDYDNDILTVKGWIFSGKDKLEKIQIMIDTNQMKKSIPIKYGIKRNDVYQTFQNPYAKSCGFYGQILIENVRSFKVWLAYTKNKKSYKLCIGEFNDNVINSEIPPRVSAIETSENGMDLQKMIDNQERYHFEFPGEYYSQTVDVIIPVYNGYEFLDKLLDTVSLTKMKYRVILIHDKSTDERVLPFLKDYTKAHDNVVLIENEENLGFVKTVNKGFEYSSHHIALVNTDVELPDMWLERLMLPIFRDDKVASSTPFTNCGTICSFPDFGNDNELFLDLTVQEIDNEFKKIPPKYESMPTGIGFCMGINRNAMDRVGLFDAESFGKGYGEENDWCQRAIKLGYKNIHVENLFVYHKHGGSFLSEDKKRYLEEHEKILLKKHPYYNKDVARFCTMDPNKNIREFVKLNLLLNSNEEYRTILAFDHDLGGGASKYLLEKKNHCIEEGNAFVVVRFDFVKEYYKILYFYKNYKIKFHIKEEENLFWIMNYIHICEIWINELVTYPNLYELLKAIQTYKQEKNLYVKMLVHDFFSVCPTINLLNNQEEYCYLPNCKVCDECLKKSTRVQSLEYGTMEKWRLEWGTFLHSCNEVVCFSEDSKNIMQKVFGELDNLIIIPHQVEYMPVINKKYKTTSSLNVGLLGNLTKHKGRTIVKQMVQIIEKKGLNIRIVLIGSSSKKINSKAFKETGRYTRDSIPRLVLENDIDVFLIPSIWPETFSYTTAEIMQMNMPIMCFDIGAPAERVAKYEQGIVIPKISPEAVIKELQENPIINEALQKKERNKKILFVVEEITFSSRYRVDHLREQLLHQGIQSECCLIKEAYNVDIKKYESVVVYRSSEVELVEKLVRKAHRFGKKVFYDIDDYIFEYNEICDLKFLEGDDYKDFDVYSKNIKQTMGLCDGFIVSTENLKSAIAKSFPNKSVYINRNVASMEMLTISKGCFKCKGSDVVKLGYFSGSKTHNEDFESIKDEILYIMEKNQNVQLFIGGQIELPPEFNSVKERIEKFDFVSWKKLPKLIAQADINLMPLEDSFFHACKSENKWMEAALVGVPTVASWNNELAGAIENDVTGYLCGSVGEWRMVLQRLIDDEDLRFKIAKAAHEKVLKCYTTFKIEPDIVDILTGEQQYQ